MIALVSAPGTRRAGGRTARAAGPPPSRAIDHERVVEITVDRRHPASSWFRLRASLRDSTGWLASQPGNHPFVSPSLFGSGEPHRMLGPVGRALGGAGGRGPGHAGRPRCRGDGRQGGRPPRGGGRRARGSRSCPRRFVLLYPSGAWAGGAALFGGLGRAWSGCGTTRVDVRRAACGPWSRRAGSTRPPRHRRQRARGLRPGRSTTRCCCSAPRA